MAKPSPASDKLILAVNCGSSSIKFKLFALSSLAVLFSGSASNVEQKGAKPTIKYVVHHNEHGHEEEEKKSEEEDETMAYEAVFERIIAILEDSQLKHFATDAHDRPRDLIRLVAHRVVHGGSETEPMLIWPGHEEGMDKLDKLSEFAPLHNHRSVLVIKACLEHLPAAHQVLCYDTLFHATLPKRIYTYPLSPPSVEPPIPLRKYGAHGLSYASVLRSVAGHLKKPEKECNLIIAHLGSGASVCLVRAGKSEDTSMGVSPLDGMPGGTRTGSVDPTLIFHHTPDAGDKVDLKGVSVTKAEMIMNTEGGLQAVCGTSDFGKILSKLPKDFTPGSPPADEYQLAYDLFFDRLLNLLGAYLLKLRGSPSAPSHLDGIVFSGGIGERAVRLRRDVGRHLGWLGCEVDEDANGKESDDVVVRITRDGSGVPLFVCKTDEEEQCARMAQAHANDV